MKVWVVINSHQSNRRQAEGLAKALGYPFEIIFSVIPKWQRLFTMRYISKRKNLLNEKHFAPPWPDIVIGCGRHSIPFLLALKTKLKEKIKTIYINDPRIASHHFDYVIPKTHDRIKGINVIPSIGSLNNWCPKGLNEAQKKPTPITNQFKPPYLLISIGGGSRTCRYLFTKNRCRKVIHFLQGTIKIFPGTVYITPSRRTGAKNIEMIKEAVSNIDNVYFDEMISSTNYLIMLSMARFFLISNDSVNMLTEACSRDRPVYYFKLPGFRHSTKLKKFLTYLEHNGYIKPFSGKYEDWKHPILNESMRIAKTLKKMIHDT